MFFTPVSQKIFKSFRESKKTLDTSEKATNFVKSIHSRTINYASRTPLEHCDQPAILIASIPHKFLKRVNHNVYEVVVTMKDFKHANIEGFKPLLKPSAEELSFLVIDEALKMFEDTSLQERLKRSFNRISGF